MRAPLAFVAAAFALGISIVGWWHPGAQGLWWSVFGLWIAFLFLRRRPAISSALLLGLVLLVGSLRAHVDAQLPMDSIARILTLEPKPILCEGTVVSDAEWHRFSYGALARQGWLKVESIRQPGGSIPASGQVFVRWPSTGVKIAYGDRVQLIGEIRAGRHTKGFDEAGWLWLQGACGILTVSDPQAITKIYASPTLFSRYRRKVALFRERLKYLDRFLLGPLEAGYLEALVLGDGQGISSQTWESFRKTGTIHVLVVSGLHVGLIGGIWFIALGLCRMPRGLRFLLTSAALAAYCTLTGANPPILRATITGALLCFGLYQGQRISALNSLGFAALLILGSSPRVLYDASFQLSFGSVLGILTLTPRLTKPFQEKEWWNLKPCRWIAQSLAVSVGAWVAVTPLTAWHFHTVTPMALLANLIVVPWSSALIAMGLVLYGAGWIDPRLACSAGATFSWATAGLHRLVVWLAQQPGGSWSW